MRKNYHFNRNPKRLSGEEIARHKDFDSLLEMYQQTSGDNTAGAVRPLRVRWLAYASAVAVAAALIGVIFFSPFQSLEPYEERQTAFFASQDYIEPPLQSVIQTRYFTYRINANAGGVFEYESGSRITVPAAAFETSEGEIVEGEVEIRYRELHDYVDFFLSGIPMVYDSAGVRYTLESAGMVEIYAEKDGQRVEMRNGKTIDVELISFINVPNVNIPPKYNIYQLDTASRNWVYQDIDRIEVIESDFQVVDENHPFYEIELEFIRRLEELQEEKQRAETMLNAEIAMPVEPIRPVQHNGADLVFDFDFSDQLNTNNAQYQSLYNGTLWQLSDQETTARADLNRLWEDVRIQKINEHNYQLTLIDGQEELTVLVHPVLSGSDYEEAMRQYNQQFEIYQQQMGMWEYQSSQRRDSLHQVYQDREQALALEFNQTVESYRSRGPEFADLEYTPRKKVINRFKAPHFGIWNCDRPLPPHMVQMTGNFVDQNGRAYENNVGYLVDRSRNTIMRFFAAKNTEMRFDANSQNLLWLVTDDNRLAVFRPEDFKQIDPSSTSYTFELEVIDRLPDSEADVREILQF
jgi:hypothetical protein